MSEQSSLTNTGQHHAAEAVAAYQVMGGQEEDRSQDETIRIEDVSSPEDHGQIASDDSPNDANKNARAIEHPTSPIGKARAEYVQLSAGRGNRAFHFGPRFSKLAVAEARTQYEDQKKQQLQREHEAALESGAKPEDLSKQAAASVIREAERLANEVEIARLLATGKWEFQQVTRSSTGESSRQLVRIGRPFVKDRLVNAFAKQWGKDRPHDVSAFSKEGIKLSLKRAGLLAGTVVAPAGIAVASVAAPPLVFGPAAGYFTNLLVGHALNKSSGSTRFRDEERVFRDAAAIQQAIHEAIYAALLPPTGNDPGEIDHTVSDVIDRQTKEEAAITRRKASIRLGAAAIAGSTAGGVGLHMMLNRRQA